MADAEIEKTLVISTGHLSMQSREWMDAPDGARACLSFMAWDYGWAIHTGRVPNPEIPADVEACLVAGRRHQCAWVRLDGDAERYGGLEWFEDNEPVIVTDVRLASL